MTAIHLYYPLNILKPFGENIWIADGGEIRMAFPLGVKIPFSTRMTVVRLSDGGLWCHSPVAPAPELFAQIDAGNGVGKHGRARTGGGAEHRRGV